MFVGMLDTMCYFNFKTSCKNYYYCSVEGMKLGYRLDGPSFAFV